MCCQDGTSLGSILSVKMAHLSAETVSVLWFGDVIVLVQVDYEDCMYMGKPLCRSCASIVLKYEMSVQCYT